MTTSPSPAGARRSRPVVALVLMLLLGAAGCLVGAVAPLDAETPVRLQAALAAVGVTAAALVAWRPCPTTLHLGLAVTVVGTGLLLTQAATPVGTLTAALSLLWVVLYAGAFQPRRTARLCTGAAAATLLAGVALNPQPGLTQSAGLLLITMLVAGEVLQGLVAQLQTQSTTDPLTGALNRAGLSQAGDALLRTAQRHGQQVTVAVLDLDRFKAVNDTRGHAAGDALLRRFAHALASHVRSGDVLARLGGDEFVVLLRAGAPDQHALRSRLAALTDIPHSVGITVTDGTEPLEDVLARADQSLYLAKGQRVPAPRTSLRLHDDAATAPAAAQLAGPTGR